MYDYYGIMETWKQIVGYTRYEVSSLGRIRSLIGVPKILKTNSINNGGYASVILCENGKNTRHTIHRLVGKAFIPNPDDLPQIDHINHNRLDNSVSNLRWVTSTENNLNKRVTHSTDEHYIYTSFRVAVPGYKEKRFKTFEEALEYKNSLQVYAAPLDGSR
jgi:hypothetical protein